MKTNHPSKLVHFLIIVLMLLNPALVAGDTLFSHATQLDINTQSNDSYTFSTTQQSTSCHDSEMQKLSISAECCEELCQCSTSSCSPATTTVNLKNRSLIVLNYSFVYPPAHYLSLISSPSSPPPIV